MSFFQNRDFLSILEKTQIDFRSVFIIFFLDLSDCKVLYSDRYFTKNGGVFEVQPFGWRFSSQMTSSSGISISKGILRWRTTARTKMLKAVEALMPKPSQSVSKRFFKSESKRIVYADCDIMMLFWWQKYSNFLKYDRFLQKKWYRILFMSSDYRFL